jgi:hypothetical protein
LIHATSLVYALVHLLLLIFAFLLCFFFWGSAVVIETVAIQDEMTQQASLLDHSEEQVQQGNGDNYKNAQGSSNTPQISTKSDDG